MNRDPSSVLDCRGPQQLGDAELLSFLLTRGGAPGPGAISTAHALLERIGGLHGLLRAGPAELEACPGIGPAKALRLRATAALCRRLADRPPWRGQPVDHPAEVWRMVRGRLLGQTRERLLLLTLDRRCRLIAVHEVVRGAAASLHCEPRALFELALRDGADSILLVHNHPSGDPTPSQADVDMSHQVQAAAQLLDLLLLDHVVVGDGTYCSLAEMGHLDPWPPGLRARPVRAADGPRWSRAAADAGR